MPPSTSPSSASSASPVVARSQHILTTLLLAFLLPLVAMAQEEPEAAPTKAPTVDMEEMMRRAQAFTQPSEHHQLLERFIGTWDTLLRVTMPGMAGEPDPGTMTFSWLMDGRWLQGHGKGMTFGQPSQSFMVLGYDNLKMSYITMSITSIDTAMLIAEGDLDPSGKALISYGTLDEYLTGEHDKMVKYVWRFLSDDKMVLEVHDLPIGEHDAKVIEVTYSRHKETNS